MLFPTNLMATQDCAGSKREKGFILQNRQQKI
jgi:hypothetical protein